MVIGLDEEGVVGQNVCQQGAGGVHDTAHPLAVQPGQQPLVGVLRHTGRDAACEDEHIAFGQRIELFFQRVQGRSRDGGACAVQLGLFPGFDLHVDAGHAVVERKIVMVKVNVKNGTLDQKEIDAYVQYAIEANPGKLVTELDIDIDGDFANLTYHFGEIPFDRIRRITGYLVGTLDRFNNAKKAEVEDRVKHSIAPDVEDDIYVTA